MQRNYAKYNIGVSKASKELSQVVEQNEIAAVLKKNSIVAYIVPAKRFEELINQVENNEKLTE
jgi:PHD/YefM family antitoxin component YafN of YafNO toxin-antitoxin module